MDKDKIIIAFFVIMAGFFLLGIPSSISIMGFQWDFDSYEDEIVSDNTEELKGVYASDLLSINDLKPRQEIYGINEVAKVDFFVDDQISTPYSLKVYWIHDNDKYLGWEEEKNESGGFWASYTVHSPGLWKTQVVVNWDILNESYSKDSVTTFEVI